MTCGFGQHNMQFNFHNPYDDRDVYECTRCGKANSREARPLFTSKVTLTCCSQTQEWTGMSSRPAFAVGDPIDCPVHGSSVIAAIETAQVRGKAIESTFVTTGNVTPAAAPPTGHLNRPAPWWSAATVFTAMSAGVILGVVLGWIPMLVFGGAYLVWLLMVAAVVTAIWVVNEAGERARSHANEAEILRSLDEGETVQLQFRGSVGIYTPEKLNPWPASPKGEFAITERRMIFRQDDGHRRESLGSLDQLRVLASKGEFIPSLSYDRPNGRRGSDDDAMYIVQTPAFYEVIVPAVLALQNHA